MDDMYSQLYDSRPVIETRLAGGSGRPGFLTPPGAFDYSAFDTWDEPDKLRIVLKPVAPFRILATGSGRGMD